LAAQSVDNYSGFQMSVYSFENKKSVPLRVLSFHFAVGKMKTAIYDEWLFSIFPNSVRSIVNKEPDF